MRCHPFRSLSFRLLVPAIVNAALLGVGRLGYASNGGDPEEALPTVLRLQEAEAPAPPVKETEESPWRTLEIAGGVTYSSLTSTLLMTHEEFGAGLAVDGEEALGLKREHLGPDAWGSLRFADRHRIKIHFEDVSRSATTTIQQSVTVNGTVFSAGTSVHTVFGVDQFDLSYIWSFLKNDCMEIGFALHADVVRLHLALEAEGLGEAANERYLLPVPLGGFDADFILAKNIWLRQSVSGSYLPLANFTGILLESSTSLEFSFLKNLSLGVGVHYWVVEVTKDTEAGPLGNFEGKFRFTSAGLFLYLNFHL